MASASFKTAIRSDTREIKGYVEIYDGLVDLKTGDTVTASEAECSKKAQVIDDIRMPIDYASFEDNFFDDEGMILPNDPDGGDNENIGWISTSLSNSSGVFASDQTIKVTLSNTTNSLNGLTIYFRHGYPIDFDLLLTNSSNVTTTINITGNDESVYQYTTAITNLKSVEIQIANWSEGYRRARISEIDFEVSDMYESGILIDFQTTEQVSKLSLEMPKNEVIVNLSNQDGRFDYINPVGMAKYLTENKTIRPYVGVLTEDNGVEYVSLGYFYLTEWINNDDLTTTLTGLNLLNLLDKVTSYDRNEYGAAGYQARGIFPRLYFKMLCDRWGVKYLYDNEYPPRTVITPPEEPFDYYYPYSITDGRLPIWTRKEQIQYLAMTGFGNIQANRDNKLCFYQIPTTISNTIYRNNIEKDAKFTTKTKLKEIIWHYPQHQAETSGTGGKVVYSNTIYINGTEDVYIQTPYAVTASVDTGTVNSIFLGGNFVRVNITSTGDTVLTLNATNDILSDTTTDYTYTYNTTGETLEITNAYLWYLNYLSSYLGVSYVSLISDWINDNYDNYNVMIQWGQDPTIEVGQLLSVETPYGFKNVFVEKQVIKFDGGLSGYTEGVGN